MAVAEQQDVQDDAGLSLVELIVTMAVFSGVMLLIFGLLLSVQKHTVQVADRETAITVSRQAVAQIDRQVRSGNVLFAPGNEVEGQPNGTVGCVLPKAPVPGVPDTDPAGLPNFGNCMRIYTQSNGAGTCVQWQVVEDAERPGTDKLQTRSWTPGSGAPAPWSIVVRGLASTPTQWPFRLQGADSEYDFRLVDVQLTVAVAGSDRTEDVATSLSGRNTYYGYDPNTCNPVPPAA